jgi:hypothetical protein
MAEVLAVAGAIGTVVGTVDTLSASFGALNGTHDEPDDAGNTIASLEAQLEALKTALFDVRAWIESMADSAFRQLVDTINDSVAGWKMLVDGLELCFSSVHSTDGSSPFTKMGKVAARQQWRRIPAEVVGLPGRCPTPAS